MLAGSKEACVEKAPMIVTKMGLPGLGLGLTSCRTWAQEEGSRVQS